MAWTNITNGTLPDADEVMDNFNLSRNRQTITAVNAETSTTSSSFQTKMTLTTPAALTSSQNVQITASITLRKGNAGDTAQVELYDNTAGVQLAVLNDAGISSAYLAPHYIQATVTLASATDTKEILLRYRRSAGSTAAVYAIHGVMTATLIDNS